MPPRDAVRAADAERAGGAHSDAADVQSYVLPFWHLRPYQVPSPKTEEPLCARRVANREAVPVGAAPLALVVSCRLDLQRGSGIHPQHSTREYQTVHRR